jgi:hypothetical protein
MPRARHSSQHTRMNARRTSTRLTSILAANLLNSFGSYPRVTVGHDKHGILIHLRRVCMHVPYIHRWVPQTCACRQAGVSECTHTTSGAKTDGCPTRARHMRLTRHGHTYGHRKQALLTTPNVSHSSRMRTCHLDIDSKLALAHTRISHTAPHLGPVDTGDNCEQTPRT